jgi:2,4-dienoyl-CoA reductase-like NADH-dependent reductase (Old Yellow Enzyme family)
MAENERGILRRDSQPHLFSHISLRSVSARNRIMLSPMWQYSAGEGMPNDWHLVHLGARAAGRAGIVFTEAVAIEPRGGNDPGQKIPAIRGLSPKRFPGKPEFRPLLSY